jgi:hypothetical protein
MKDEKRNQYSKGEFIYPGLTHYRLRIYEETGFLGSGLVMMA